MKTDALNHFKEEMNKRGLFRKILECALQRVIQTGYYQKEHKECKHGEASLHE